MPHTTPAESTTDSTDPVLPARAVVLTNPGDPSATVTATVVTLEHRDEHGFDGRRVGLDAHLRVLLPGDTRPHSYFLSRLAGEHCWVQDAHIGPGGVPHFSNGFGARYLKLNGIHPALEALLDEATRARGLATTIGPGVPLVLPDPDTTPDAAG